MRLWSEGAVVSLLLYFLGVHGSKADVLWTANVNFSYMMDNRTLWEEGEIGVYGHDSPIDRSYGLVILPKRHRQSNYYACPPNVNFSIPENWHGPWIALIQRGGGCTFTEKINAASIAGARAVVIYNNNAEDNEVIEMSHPENTKLCSGIKTQQDISDVQTDLDVGVQSNYAWKVRLMLMNRKLCTLWRAKSYTHFQFWREVPQADLSIMASCYNGAHIIHYQHSGYTVRRSFTPPEDNGKNQTVSSHFSPLEKDKTKLQDTSN